VTQHKLLSPAKHYLPVIRIWWITFWESCSFSDEWVHLLRHRM